MRRSRRQREQLTVSLFPFLAVLICTLGVLILMLVMAAKNADVEARQIRKDSQEQQHDKVSELEVELNTRLVEVEGLREVRPEATKRLQRIRNFRSHLEAEIRQLDKQANQLARQLNLLDLKIQKPIETTASIEEIASLESKIELVSSELEETRKSSTEFIPVTYSILPQPGPTGTFRRPIYIECNQQGVVLQPSGLVLDQSDLVEPVLPGNPLDAALLVIREYWNRYDLAGAEGNPYPLLVIRPSGANSYVAARRAMKSWDDEFGYEIVEEDKVLDFGSADPQLTAEIKSAIADSKRRQSAMVAAAIERRSRLRNSVNGNSRQRPGLVASGPLGGFVSTGGDTQAMQVSAGDQFSASGNSDLNEPAFDSVLDQYRDSNRTIEKSQTSANPQSAPPKNAPSAHETNTPQIGKQNGNQNGNANFYSPTESLANERGQGWALPSQSAGGTGYLRPVRIFCADQQLGVRTATDDLVVIPMNGSTEEAVEALIDVIWKMIDGWGSAGASGYWKPELRITVQPTGRRRFEELKTLLNQSGLEIKEFGQ